MEIEIYDKVSPSPSLSLKNANFFIYWPILMKFDFFEGGGGGPFIIYFYLNYTKKKSTKFNKTST